MDTEWDIQLTVRFIKSPPFCLQGRFTIAAKHHITIAEVYESELVDIEKAIAHYEQAADYYKGEESNSSANKCLLKVASYSAQLEQYPKAIEIYEQVGTSTMDNPLLKYSAKEYFFKASLCHFIVDELNAKLAVGKYEEMFPAFSDSRECKLLKKLLEAHEEQNAEAFTEAVKEFDTISRLDQWHTTMLLRIKKTIQGDEGDLKWSVRWGDHPLHGTLLLLFQFSSVLCNGQVQVSQNSMLKCIATAFLENILISLYWYIDIQFYNIAHIKI